MADQDLVAQKIKSYLEGLSPRARKMLLDGIELSQQKGDADERLGTIMAVARTMVRKKSGEGYRHDRIMRAFFEPVSPFLYNGTIPKKQRGRIARSSLGRIWTWIVRDVAPRPLEELLAHEKANPDLDTEAVNKATDQVRSEIQRVIRAHLDEVKKIPRGAQRLAIQLGGTNQIHDLEDVLDVLRHEAEFDKFFKHAPKRVGEHGIADGHATPNLVRAFSASFPGETVFIASGLLGRVQKPQLLVNLAINLAKTDTARTIIGTPYGAFIEIVMSEIERHVDAFAETRDIGMDAKGMAAEIENYHGLMRTLEVDLELDGAVEWVSRLSTIRRRMSELVSAEIEPVPGLIRHCIGHTTAGGERPTLDAHALSDARRGLNALIAARHAAESLAVNELQSRTWRAVEDAVEILSHRLLERFRVSTGAERIVIEKKLDVAIEFSSLVLGHEYATILTRGKNSADGARHKGRAAG